jgi:RNA 2',3'-cyclic 3'-phosphodiesterase
MEQIRSFIAIELPEPVKAELKRIEDSLKLTDSGCAKWVDPYGIHLTLKFLGNIDAEKVGAIVEMMDDAAHATPPFHLELKGLGAFPDPRRAQVIWVGVGGDIEKLQDLQKRLESNLANLGFPPEGRTFTPHLTLARIRDYATPVQRQTLGDGITSFKLESDRIFQVSSLSLMKSQLTRSGAIYTELRAVELKGGA